MVASEYIDRPLLIDGFKFDLRIYVALTSINPLRLYVYEDGLARFATGKYTELSNSNADCKKTRLTHLTNYSLNKNSVNFVNNTDAMQDDVGSKWSLVAFRNRLKKMGLDDELLFKKINDLIVKTVISVEHIVNNANEMFCPYPKSNCFELFGFDVLVDVDMNPWLLEVNLTPALGCDSPLDQKIKANVISDLFTVCGLVSHDARFNEPM